MFKKLLTITLLLTYSSLLFAQTCNPNIRETTPTSRFTPNNDGTVLDTKTSLVWKVCSEGQIWAGEGEVTVSCTGTATRYTWKVALESVQTLNTNGGFAGQTDWRLPNIKELASIAELKCYNPAINEAVFPNTSSWFWSSSLNAYGSRNAWVRGFDSGYYDATSGVDSNAQVRLVRSL